MAGYITLGNIVIPEEALWGFVAGIITGMFLFSPTARMIVGYGAEKVSEAIRARLKPK